MTSPITFQNGSKPQPVAPAEVIYVADTRVCCDGGGGALGHPKVWYSVEPGTPVDCMYCDRQFIYDPEKANAP